jgi:hypothetical protein
MGRRHRHHLDALRVNSRPEYLITAVISSEGATGTNRHLAVLGLGCHDGAKRDHGANARSSAADYARLTFLEWELMGERV